MNKLIVNISQQSISLLDPQGKTLKKYPCSTSAYGVGSQSGSNKTPLGIHRIAEKYGHHASVGAVFSSREFTGEIAQISHSNKPSGKDLITSRILRLKGLEEGKNVGDGIDSYDRYIYIHGTADEGLIGQPSSHGCVRMKNIDIIQLFDLVDEGTEVDITL